MARSQAQVLAEFFSLQYQGWALPTDASSVWGTFLSPLAAEIATAEASAEALLAEIDPRTAANLLPDYERALAPDPYGRDAASLGLSTSQRGTLAWQRWTASGNANPADYVALAASIGATITIQEYWQSEAGVAQCGVDALCADRYAECGVATCGRSGLWWEPVHFKWLVRGPASLGSLLKAVLAGERPAHTEPVYILS